MIVGRKNMSSLFICLCLLVASFTASKPIYAAADHTERFLSITDIHFDPFLSCNNVAPCPLVERLRHAPSDQWKAILAELDTEMPIYAKNTNYKLLESALSGFKNAAASQHPRFILLLGDLLAHDYQKDFEKYASDQSFVSYQSFVKKSRAFLASEIKTTFPETDVYYAVGNHDSYHNPFSSYPNGEFFKDMSDIWSALVKDTNTQEAMKQTFQMAGYYAIDLPQQSNARLIVLNSVLFSTDAEGQDIDSAAEKELTWLHAELNAARNQQQHIIIAMHIPMGVDIDSSLHSSPFKLTGFWKPAYTSRFLAELEEYAADVTAILPGHFHMDWFQVYHTKNGHSIPMSGTPSISSALGNNPAFKMFSYDTKSLMLENYVTYSYSFQNHSWDEEYDFNATYQPNCSNCEISHAMNTIEPDGDTAEQYKKYFAVGNDHLSPLINQLWMPYIWCNVRNITVQDYETCLHEKMLHSYS